MTDFEAIDALLADARQETPLPPADERRALRERLGLSRTQVAKALAVTESRIGGWEAGREPSGEARDKYAYFLQQAQAKLAPPQPQPKPQPAPPEPPTPTPTAAPTVPDGDDVVTLATPRPCVLCGGEARHAVEGFPQHLDPADCDHPAAAG
uniref:helix-turn-helix domain-containing protein n=1 Tax=Streptomyces sp. TRM64462 TaxID=2741726 RepID=UPI001586CDA3